MWNALHILPTPTHLFFPVLFRGFLPIFLPPTPHHYCFCLHIRLPFAGHRRPTTRGTETETLASGEHSGNFPSSFHKVGKKNARGRGGWKKEETLFSCFGYAYLSQFTLIFSKNEGGGIIKRRDLKHAQQPLHRRLCLYVNSISLTLPRYCGCGLRKSSCFWIFTYVSSFLAWPPFAFLSNIVIYGWSVRDTLLDC